MKMVLAMLGLVSLLGCEFENRAGDKACHPFHRMSETFLVWGDGYRVVCSDADGGLVLKEVN